MSAVAAAAERTSMRDVATLEALYEQGRPRRVHAGLGTAQEVDPVGGAEVGIRAGASALAGRQGRADAAGRLIDVSLAERRNLVMRNPAEAANFDATRTLVCAYQMILPGEQAPTHRHSSHALHVIIDGKGSFSTVNGEKMPMETGDV